MLRRTRGITIVALLAVLILLLPAVAADQADEDTPQEHQAVIDSFAQIDQEMLDEAVTHYNEDIADELPGIVSSLVRNERINVYIEDDAGDEHVFGVATDGVAIETARIGGVDNATLRIYTSVETLDSIIYSDEPLNRTVEALETGEIRYEAEGFFRNLKMRFLTWVLGVLG